MTDHVDTSLTHEVAVALEREPRVSLTHRPLHIGLDHGDLVLEGEVEDVAAKKLALERAGSIPGVTRILDRLHVATEKPVPDQAILQHIVDALHAEPWLKRLRLIPRPLEPGEKPTLALDERGYISVHVKNGVVTLDGEVPSLDQKRLAGHHAWWIEGVRDVVNGLGVEPPEPDSEAAITRAVNLAIARDPWLHSRDDIHVRTFGTEVHLTGSVATPADARQAERDAWCTFGVDRVVNRLALRPPH